MDRGKSICKTLKELRKRIADANGITYEIEECPNTEPCPGTCPKCEQEHEDLLKQLETLKKEGKETKLKDLITEEQVLMLLASVSSNEEDDDETRLSGYVPLKALDLQGDI